MQKIVDVHIPGIKKNLVDKAIDVFYDIRDVPGLKKKPSTSELLDWLKLLLNEDISARGAAGTAIRPRRSRRCTARCSRTSRT